jgi:hypothetical protein
MNWRGQSGDIRARPYAFEVSFCLAPPNGGEILVFSKRMLKVWPNCASVARRIDRVMAAWAFSENGRPLGAIIEVFECKATEKVRRVGGGDAFRST